MPFCQSVLFSKAPEIDTVMKRNESNYIGILSDQGEAENASNLSEYTLHLFSVLLFHPDVDLGIHSIKISFILCHNSCQIDKDGGGGRIQCQI